MCGRWGRGAAGVRSLGLVCACCWHWSCRQQCERVVSLLGATAAVQHQQQQQQHEQQHQQLTHRGEHGLGDVVARIACSALPAAQVHHHRVDLVCVWVWWGALACVGACAFAARSAGDGTKRVCMPCGRASASPHPPHRWLPSLPRRLLLLPQPATLAAFSPLLALPAGGSRCVCCQQRRIAAVLAAGSPRAAALPLPPQRACPRLPGLLSATAMEVMPQ